MFFFFVQLCLRQVYFDLEVVPVAGISWDPKAREAHRRQLAKLEEAELAAQVGEDGTVLGVGDRVCALFNGEWQPGVLKAVHRNKARGYSVKCDQDKGSKVRRRVFEFTTLSFPVSYFPFGTILFLFRWPWYGVFSRSSR
jgi:hypothetical protein